MLDVCLLGTAGMMPDPRRWLTALLLRYNGNSMLIDCGEATQIAIKESGWSPNPISVICFTHYHADHISGLPGLLLTMGNADRTEPVTMIGPKGLVRIVSALRSIAPELPFEINFIELEEDEQDIEVDGFHIHATKVKHNVVCYGYTVEIPRAGRFSVDNAKALGLPVEYWSVLQRGEIIEYNGKQYTPDMVVGPVRKGIKLSYFTDSRPTDAIADAARNADLFICEGMYAEPEMEAKARKKKHMTFYEAAELAKKAQVKELWLTHFSPSLMKPKQYMPAVREIFENAHLGEDGKMTVLEFEED